MRLDYIKDYAIGFSEGKFQSIKVEMEYLPNLSKNRYKTRDGFIKYNVKDWMASLAWIIRATLNASLSARNEPLKPPLKLKIEGEFVGTGRMPDCQNFVDIVADAVEEGTGINDNQFVIETGLSKRGNDPKLIITIEQYSNK